MPVSHEYPRHNDLGDYDYCPECGSVLDSTEKLWWAENAAQWCCSKHCAESQEDKKNHSMLASGHLCRNASRYSVTPDVTSEVTMLPPK